MHTAGCRRGRGKAARAAHPLQRAAFGPHHSLIPPGPRSSGSATPPPPPTIERVSTRLTDAHSGAVIHALPHGMKTRPACSLVQVLVSTSGSKRTISRGQRMPTGKAASLMRQVDRHACTSGLAEPCTQKWSWRRRMSRAKGVASPRGTGKSAPDVSFANERGRTTETDRRTYLPAVGKKFRTFSGVNPRTSARIERPPNLHGGF